MHHEWQLQLQSNGMTIGLTKQPFQLIKWGEAPMPMHGNEAPAQKGKPDSRMGAEAAPPLEISYHILANPCNAAQNLAAPVKQAVSFLTPCSTAGLSEKV